MKYIFTFITILITIALICTLSAQTEWTKENNPLLNYGSPGDWNDYSLFPACIFFDGSIYHMWYGGHDGTNVRIGYATSPDGISWTPYSGNPVMDLGAAGSWEDEWVADPYVLFDGNTYHMWYDGYDGTYMRIGYATSTDGITWTKYADNPIMDKSPTGGWASGGVGTPCILYHGGNYHIWYCGWNTSQTFGIGYATSSDGLTWIPAENNPILKPDPGKWDSHRVEGPDVFFDGSLFHMWYTGGTSIFRWQWHIGYATSPDGITWTKHKENPILSPDAGKWDSQYVGYSRILLDSTNAQFQMWYGGGSSDWHAKFGYATAPVSYEALFEYTHAESSTYKFTDLSVGIITRWLWDFGDGDTSAVKNPVHTYDLEGTYKISLTVSGPFGYDSTSRTINITHLEENEDHSLRKYNLYQNYPNPFNPLTTIEFTLPKSEFVELKVYNILGKEVSTLVSNKLNQGNHTYKFDGKNLASGVYYYRLEADNFVETRKMIYLK